MTARNGSAGGPSTRFTNVVTAVSLCGWFVTLVAGIYLRDWTAFLAMCPVMLLIVGYAVSSNRLIKAVVSGNGNGNGTEKK
jgi:hypothetical protein